jgi:hypothetical protein
VGYYVRLLQCPSFGHSAAATRLFRDKRKTSSQKLMPPAELTMQIPLQVNRVFRQYAALGSSAYICVYLQSAARQAAVLRRGFVP